MAFKIQEIEPAHLKKWVDGGQALLIDVREHLEYKEEHISKALLHPTSRFNPKELPDPFEKKIVFYCLSGKRSTIACSKWAEYNGAHEAYYLQGGLEAWKKIGYPTVHNLETERKVEHQAYRIAGGLVILGSLLTGLVSEVFLVISLFTGGLLLYSGLAGHCYISYLLSKLPNNK